MLGVLIEIIDQNRDRLRRVPRRFEYLQPHPPEVQRVALSKASEVKIGLGLGPEAYRGPKAVSKFDVTGEKIGVKMGEKDVVNVELMLISVTEILIDIALRINHDRSATRLVGDEVGRMRKTAKVVLFQPHGIFLLCMLVATSPPRHP